MTFGDDDDQDRSGVNEPVRGVPTLVWLMLGVILVLAFAAALVMIFGAPPSMKAAGAQSAADGRSPVWRSLIRGGRPRLRPSQRRDPAGRGQRRGPARLVDAAHQGGDSQALRPRHVVEHGPELRLQRQRGLVAGEADRTLGEHQAL